MDTTRKAFLDVRSEINDEEQSIISVITTDVVDRDGEVVLPKGLDLTEYRDNPVVMFAHDYSRPPVAKNLWIKPQENGLVAKTQFARTDAGRELFGLYRDGFLKGFSVGFLPERGSYGPPTQKEIQARPDWRLAKALIRKAKLVEYSVVPIPCNPEALVRAYQSKALVLSDGLAKELNLSIETPTPSSQAPNATAATASGLERVTAQQARAAIKEALARIDPAELVRQMDVPALIQERLHVARGGV